MEGLIGRKVGMTEVYDEQGRRIPVTVIEAGPCPVVQVKSVESDGYDAVQLGFGEQKPQRLSKAEREHCGKAGVQPCRVLREFAASESGAVKPGDSVDVSIFDGVKYVDVSGVTKGRGFAGVVKRYRMAGGFMTHGGQSKRRIGSIGALGSRGPHKGKRMPGQMGAVNRKGRNLAVVQVRGADNLLLVRGSIPGPKGGVVIVRKALRK